jgi:hypothetical protein
MNEAIAEIARRLLGVETLQTRNRDALDFHDVAVWQLKAALEAAYRAGAGSVTSPSK